MISQSQFSKDILTHIASQYPRMDTGLLEKVLRAIQLLESLAVTEVPFIFKGGTAAMLLLPVPHRFSIDIDIMLDGQRDLEAHFDSICRSNGFTRHFRQDRTERGGLQKNHYKFLYDSVVSGNLEQPVLLDVVYQDNPYPVLQDTPITVPFLNPTAPTFTVKTPTVDGLVGDKMTAFAPETTGIPYVRRNRDMSLEIAKQLYDIGTLFDRVMSVQTIMNSFKNIASREILNRGLKITYTEVALDLIDTALTISTQGTLGQGRVKELLSGIGKLKSFVFSETYTTAKAITHAARAAYLAVLVMNGQTGPISRFEDPLSIGDLMITDHAYSKLNKLKKTNPEAFYYWYQSIDQL